MSLTGARPRTPTMRRTGSRMAANGPTTEQFFVDGDFHEGTQWKHARLPPDDTVEVNPDAQFDSFDRIPRRNRIVLSLGVIGACLLISCAAWTMVFQSKGPRVVISSLVSGVLAPHRGAISPADFPAVAQPSARPVTMAIRRPTPNTRSDLLDPPSHEEALRQPEAVQARPFLAASDRTPIGAARATAREHHASGGRSLRGFVWSPTAGGLVPAVVAPDTYH